MDAITVTVSTVSDVFESLVQGLQIFLDTNFHIIHTVSTYLLVYISSVCNFFTEARSSIISLLGCYYSDFLKFCQELGFGIQCVTTLVINFLGDIVLLIQSMYYNVIEILHTSYSTFVCLYNYTVILLCHFVENVSYFLKLTFDAFLLILQFGPNLLIFLYTCISSCILQSLHIFQTYSLNFWLHLCNMPYECQKIVLYIPLKSYAGVVLLSCLLYNYKLVSNITTYCCRWICTNLVERSRILNQKLYLYALYFKKVFLQITLQAIKCIKFIAIKTISISERFFLSYFYGKSLKKKILNALKYMKNIICFLFVPFRKALKEGEEQDLKQLQKELCSEKEKRVCVICQDRERNVLVLPCRHMCMCEQCNLLLEGSFQGCPLCRASILNTVQVYT